MHIQAIAMNPAVSLLNLFFSEWYEEIWKEIHNVCKNGVTEQTPQYYLINCEGGSLSDIRGFYNSPSVQLFLDFFMQVFKAVHSLYHHHVQVLGNIAYRGTNNLYKLVNMRPIEVMLLFPQVFEELRADRTQGEVFDKYLHMLNQTVQVLGMMIEELPVQEGMEVEGESSEEASSVFFSRDRFFDVFNSFMDFSLDVVTSIIMDASNADNCKEAITLLLSLFQTPAMMQCSNLNS